MSHSLSHFHYQILGEDTSPKLIFLHGLMGRGTNWRTFARHFSQKHQCLIYDQRGHGQSQQPESGYELLDYAKDLENILTDLQWEPPYRLVGHSMGGRVALQYANMHPEKLQSLVIVDIGATSDWNSMLSIQEKVDFVPTPFSSKEEAKAFFDGPFLDKFDSLMLKEFFYSNIEKKPSGEWGWVFSESAIKQTLENSRLNDYWPLFKQLSMPTLLLRGEKSTDLTQEDYTKILANNNRILGEVIPGAGHWVHAEKPVDTKEALEDFFEMDVVMPR